MLLIRVSRAREKVGSTETDSVELSAQAIDLLGVRKKVGRFVPHSVPLGEGDC